MCPAKTMPEHENRTFLIHIPTYEAILDFYSRSQDGIKASMVIRKIIREYGALCNARLNSGEVPDLSDLEDISEFVTSYLPKK